MTKKAAMLMKKDEMRIGVITLRVEIPAAFMARSSLFSPSWPIVIMEARRVERGSARGRTVQPPQNMNSSIILNPRPLPTSSSI